MNKPIQPYVSVLLLAAILVAWGICDRHMNGGPLILAAAMSFWAACLYGARNAPACCDGGIEDHDVL